MSSLYTRRQGIQLAYPYNERRFQKWGSKGIVQPKLNGNRCRILTDNEGKATLLSSEANELVSVPHINRAVESLLLRNIELDGELYVHGMSKQEIDSITGRTVNLHPDHERMEFHCFDLIDCTMKQVDRLDLLYKYVAPEFTGPLKIVSSTPVYTESEVLALLTLFTKEGYEGIIIREMDSTYVRQRTPFMQKWKPRKRDCYQIIGYEEAISIHGIPKNTLGSLICETDGQRFNVGAGQLSHTMRDKWWEIRQTLPGKWAVVKYQELTERGVPVPPILCEISDYYIPDEED